MTDTTTETAADLRAAADWLSIEGHELACGAWKCADGRVCAVGALAEVIPGAWAPQDTFGRPRADIPIDHPRLLAACAAVCWAGEITSQLDSAEGRARDTSLLMLSDWFEMGPDGLLGAMVTRDAVIALFRRAANAVDAGAVPGLSTADREAVDREAVGVRA